MLRKNNLNLSLDLLSCMKINESILGLFNANLFIKQNGGKIRYFHEKNKGTKVMFTFNLKIYDETDKSPSIFTERSLLNDINYSPK